jgi:uncharacterized RDD family membrane protein YckC
MYCTKCGSVVADTAAFCAACGQPAVGPTVASAAPVAPGTPVTASGWPAPPAISAQAYVPLPSPFAGFWLRFVAHIIDSILAGIAVCVIVLLVVVIVGFGFFKNAFDNSEAPDAFFTGAIVMTMVALFLLLVGGLWLYYASMESSSYQGTLGKMALGLIVTDLQGRRVTFGRATGRFCAGRVIALIPFFGGLYFLISCICAGFTEKKQALHDMIASCLVLRKS